MHNDLDEHERESLLHFASAAPPQATSSPGTGSEGGHPWLSHWRAIEPEARRKLLTGRSTFWLIRDASGRLMYIRTAAPTPATAGSRGVSLSAPVFADSHVSCHIVLRCLSAVLPRVARAQAAP